jgi:hypothetical protein
MGVVERGVVGEVEDAKDLFSRQTGGVAALERFPSEEVGHLGDLV